ncbi:AcrR family transcriptional regulator [Thermocatellispora tengchongensis]|uniref:AcrR family transcriptional regulator n=2 Tax=Thermocatellispora tengchongensis TaxID=1073253 RepID=A0A840P9D5_9ACTN|nr:TetR/AcrR family transcriptional regulator [Thermocatellispora tengchongensis]MBB5132605.1 AcrR family transcriptional regulator [Thermocatellispora tengchongensis]
MRRDELLDAAESLLADQGAHALTLAAVAERAGVSKGGLLYHFNSKDALVRAMVERLIADFDDLMATQDHDTYTKRYVAATFAAVRSGRLRRWAVVTGAAGDPTLLAPLREAMIRWNSEGLDQDGDRMTAQVVRLACEGLWEVATHAPALYDQEAQASLEHHLMSMLT